MEPPNNLPLQRTSFVGREHELDEVKRLLTSYQLLTLIGPGGCGKTRLAVHSAAALAPEFPDGIWLVELATVGGAVDVGHAVAAAISVREPPDEPVLRALGEFLRDRTVLLIIDNCEHVVDAAAHVTDALLSACPKLRILATSREPLGCTGETTYLVPSLSEAGATRLFVERAHAARPGLDVAPGDAAVAEICRRLDGVPLAIELAAARVRVFSPAQIAARLNDRFRLLGSGPRTAMPRQQTLFATVEWSYALLSEPERAVLRRLSVFSGGWTFDAAEAIVSGDGVHPYAVLDLLAQLVNKSLIVAEEHDSTVRYHLLETIRQFAQDRLDESDEADATHNRHLRYFVELAEQLEPSMRGPRALETMTQLEFDRDNLRAALDWALRGNCDLALKLAGALGWFWWARSYHSEGRRWLNRALQANPRPTLARARALYTAGWLAHHQRDLDEAHALLEESLALGRQLEDQWTIAWALHGLGRIAYFRNDPASTRALAGESLAAAERAGDPWLIAFALHLLGIAAYIESDYATTCEYYEQSLAIRRQIGYGEGIGILLSLLGIVAIRQRDFARAHALISESLQLMRGVVGEWGASVNVATFAGLAGAQGQFVEAVRLAGASAALREAWQTPLIPLIEVVVDEELARAREALEPSTYAEAWAAGRAMSQEEALAAALAVEIAPAASPQPDGLSPTERQVLALVARGLTTKEIASELVIAISTADRHITNIYNKLGVHNRAEATAYALRHGLG